MNKLNVFYILHYCNYFIEIVFNISEFFLSINFVV